MTDFDYDVMLKKRIARSAKYRKCGSKSTKCSLSSDNMTKKQWKERCGEMITCNMNKPIAWDSFKKMSKDLQSDYISGLKAEYNANLTSLAEMFGVQRATVRRFFDTAGIDLKFGVGNSMSAAQALRWKKFIAGEDEVKQNIETTEQDIENPVDSSVENQEPVEIIMAAYEEIPETPPKMSMQKFALDFDGTINLADIYNSLMFMLGEHAEGTLHISYMR